MAEALDEGASKAHAFLKKHEALVVCDSRGKPPQQIEPIEKADTDAKAWAEKWQSHDKEGVDQALAELSAHRLEALAHKESQGDFPRKNQLSGEKSATASPRQRHAEATRSASGKSRVCPMKRWKRWMPTSKRWRK